MIPLQGFTPKKSDPVKNRATFIRMHAGKGKFLKGLWFHISPFVQAKHLQYPSEFQSHPAYLTDTSTIFLPAVRQNQHASERDSFQLHASSAPLSMRLPPQRGRSLGCQTGQKTTQPSPECCRLEFAERALLK